jgi:hypothetical protein
MPGLEERNGACPRTVRKESLANVLAPPRHNLITLEGIFRMIPFASRFLSVSMVCRDIQHHPSQIVHRLARKALSNRLYLASRHVT